MLAGILEFPVRHWRGQVPLLPTLAVTLIGLRLVIAKFGGIPFVAADLGVFIWQAVGAWQAIARHQRDRPDLLALLAGIGAVLAASVAFALPVIDRLSAHHLQDIAPPKKGPSGVTMDASGIRLSGPITFEMFSAFKDAVDSAKPGDRVALNSYGGRVYAARAIAILIRQHRLNTHAVGVCASACTLIFIAGGNRSLAPEGTLGFHSYIEESQVQVMDADEEQAKDQATFRKAGVTEAFVDRMFAAPPQNMWFPGTEELRAAGVVTHP